MIEDTKKMILKIDPHVKLHGSSFVKSYRKRAVELWNIIKASREV